MTEKWRYKSEDGKFLWVETRWSAAYDYPVACCATNLPILCGDETVALAVHVEKTWPDNKAERRADQIVRAVNFHEALVEALTELTDTVRTYELHQEIDAGWDGTGPYEEAVKLLEEIGKEAAINQDAGTKGSDVNKEGA